MYDENGEAFGIDINGKEYFYVKNAQNDVVRIVDSANETVVSYQYDSWGKLLSCEDTSENDIVSFINPYTYRSYFYDSDTEMYFLKSRYYNPELCRFISADGIVNANQDILGNNLYAYCSNNPVKFCDPSGQSIALLMTAIIPACIIACVAIIGIIGIASANSKSASVAIGNAIDNVASSASVAINNAKTKVKTKAKAKEKTKVIPAPPKSKTVIYRYGGTNPGNLTPKEKDKYSGLSFSTIPRPGAAVTTIEELNATGIVYAVQDSPTHVSVRPVGATMDTWINEGSDSIWTQAVKSVVVKWDGEY